MKSAVAAAASDYDALPYRSTPYRHTQPAHLAAVATLLGMAPPVADHARVLELGCASGGNIIPLAVRYPHARFIGIDLSLRQVEDGQRAIAQLGLQNIEIRHGNIGDLRIAGPQFDYIVCHGVFSWVPRSVQDAIFRICAENLAASGIAYISYNALPGWHLRRIVRDICHYHAGDQGTPEQRVTRARWMLEQVAKMSSESSAFGRIMRDEAKLTAPLPNSYILGEFLAHDNDPCYFHEFAGRATAAGLTFLCEADLAASVPENLGAEQAKLIRAIAGSNPIAVEQYMDFFTGRTFRRSLLVKSEQASTVQRALNPQRLRPLHLISGLNRDAAASTQDSAIFRYERRAITTNDPVVQAALEHLSRCYPESCPVEQLIETVVPTGTPERANAQARLLSALLRVTAAEHISVSTLPLRTGRASARPAVWSLARMQADNGQDWASSLHHRPVQLHPALRLLMPLLDGRHERVALRDRLVAAVAGGETNIPGLEMNAPSASRPQLEAAATQIIQQMLRYLEHHALLEPNTL